MPRMLNHRRSGLIVAVWRLLVCATPLSAITLVARARAQRVELDAPRATLPRTRLRVEVNLPAYRMDVIDGDSIWSATISIGQRRYPTPRGTFQMQNVTWNPWWIPPKSEWARGEKPKAPGGDNPMGRVKMQIYDLLFLHGTPLESSLGHASSHACIRLADSVAIRLALQVHRGVLGRPGEDTLEMLRADSARTMRFTVDAPVPVSIVYRLAEIRQVQLWLYPNVYRLPRALLRAEAMRTLADAGEDTARVNRTVLARAVRLAQRAPTAVPISDLIPP